MAISISVKRCTFFELIGDLFHQFTRDGLFAHPVPAVYAVLTNDMHLVALAPHRVGGPIVRDDPVPSLARDLRPPVGHEVVRLGGETDTQPPALPPSCPAHQDGRRLCRPQPRDRSTPPP